MNSRNSEKNSSQRPKRGLERGERSSGGKGLHKQASFYFNRKAVETIEQWSQKRGKNSAGERFKVVPDYAYPSTRYNREELRREMNKSSAFYHHLSTPGRKREVIGRLNLEILQCFGIPKPDLIGETSAYCVSACGPYAFQTDIMPPVANPMWLSKMRRACSFDLYHGYARLYVGVFGANSNPSIKDGFAGRIVIDVARLRPNSTYDVTLPLRQSAHVYTLEKRGAIRVRLHLQWFSEQKALLSYLPTNFKLQPNESCLINCCDNKSFQNVARLVHGYHMPGKFSLRQLKATIREINFTQIHVVRYLRKRELRNLREWRIPLLSAYVFFGWMHSVYYSTVAYAPGHLLTYLLLHLWKNYAYYGMDSPIQNGFQAPTFEELFNSLLFGKNKEQSCIEPLALRRKDETDMDKAWDDVLAPHAESLEFKAESSRDLMERAQVFRKKMPVHHLKHRLRTFTKVFRGTDAVDFMLENNLASSRKAAVELGLLLQQQLQVFDHVHRHQEFADASHHYRFLDGWDPYDFTCTTHIPRGKTLLGLLGLRTHDQLNEADEHMEMPYASGKDHPRFGVKDSLVIRSKEQKRMLMLKQQSDVNKKNLINHADQMQKGLNDILMEDDKNNHGDDESNTEDSGDITTVIKTLKKPPHQDMDTVTKGSKSLTVMLEEVRHKVHGILLHNFNDRVFRKTPPRIPLELQQSTGLTVNSTSRRRGLVLSKGISKADRDTPNGDHPRHDGLHQDDDYNRLLNTGRFSSGNPWMSRVAVILQPLMEIALGWLSLFRALFNVFTWRDPILSFWVAILGPVVVVILHLFPWRLVLGLAGIYLWGPQNYLTRLARTYSSPDEEFDPDRILKKVKPEAEVYLSVHAPLFSTSAPNNDPISRSSLDVSDVKQVVVPYSPLMYQRFYDWPPETQYAFVEPSNPPTNLRRSDSTDVSTDSNSHGSLRLKYRKLKSPLRSLRRRR